MQAAGGEGRDRVARQPVGLAVHRRQQHQAADPKHNSHREADSLHASHEPRRQTEGQRGRKGRPAPQLGQGDVARLAADPVRRQQAVVLEEADQDDHQHPEHVQLQESEARSGAGPGQDHRLRAPDQGDPGSCREIRGGQQQEAGRGAGKDAQALRIQAGLPDHLGRDANVQERHHDRYETQPGTVLPVERHRREDEVHDPVGHRQHLTEGVDRLAQP